MADDSAAPQLKAGEADGLPTNEAELMAFIADVSVPGRPADLPDGDRARMCEVTARFAYKLRELRHKSVHNGLYSGYGHIWYKYLLFTIPDSRLPEGACNVTPRQQSSSSEGHACPVKLQAGSCPPRPNLQWCSLVASEGWRFLCALSLSLPPPPPFPSVCALRADCEITVWDPLGWDSASCTPPLNQWLLSSADIILCCSVGRPGAMLMEVVKRMLV